MVVSLRHVGSAQSFGDRSHGSHCNCIVLLWLLLRLHSAELLDEELLLLSLRCGCLQLLLHLKLLLLLLKGEANLVLLLHAVLLSESGLLLLLLLVLLLQ